MSEYIYKQLIDKYLNGKSTVEEFIDDFFNKWRQDRDANVQYKPKFQQMIDRIFTSCDCYSDSPEGIIEISEQELKSELQLLSHIWWR